MSMKDKLKYIFSLPKTIWFNLRTLPLQQAIHLPILISNDTKIYGCHRRSFHLKGKISTGSVRIGFWKGAGRMGYKTPTILNVDRGARVILGSNVAIAKGSVICVISGGVIFGDNFKGNYSLRIMCRKEISFGDDCLIAWICTFTDGDEHVLFENGERINYDEAVQIGNHVWFCAHSTVLKGTQIKDGSVVGFGALCNRKYNEGNVLLAGSPARIIKNCVSWNL